MRDQRGGRHLDGHQEGAGGGDGPDGGQHGAQVVGHEPEDGSGRRGDDRGRGEREAGRGLGRGWGEDRGGRGMSRPGVENGGVERM